MRTLKCRCTNIVFSYESLSSTKLCSQQRRIPSHSACYVAIVEELEAQKIRNSFNPVTDRIESLLGPAR